jgi:hypothetical protein
LACADTFTYTDDQKQTRTLDARLVASGSGVHVLGQADGQYLLVSQSNLQARVAGPDPEPVTVNEMQELLVDEFGGDYLRTKTEGPFIVGLVLAGPLPPQAETKANTFLRRAARFMKRVDRVFTGFCRELRLDTRRPEYPLVLLIFETDRDFDAYAAKPANGRGLDVESMAGFYSPLTNRLAMRIGECRTFEVPLHEAIHQQAYNRGVLQRLADVPVWFDEGIATGFETDGVRIDIGPTKINANYAQQVPQSTTLTWQDIVEDDRKFRGNVLAGEAYVHAWSLHWLLITQHRRGYTKYVKQLGQIAPLGKPTEAERDQLFLECFGQSVESLHKEFPRLLTAQMKREQIPAEKDGSNGNVIYAAASEVTLTARKRADEDGLLEVRGTLRNVSPYRDWAYHVTVQTDGGLYAQWHIQSVKSQAERSLNERFVDKVIDGGPGQTGSRFWVDVTCALPDSPEAERWRRGEFPIPQWDRSP